jgi:hypothetical protein
MMTTPPTGEHDRSSHADRGWQLLAQIIGPAIYARSWVPWFRVTLLAVIFLVTVLVLRSVTR